MVSTHAAESIRVRLPELEAFEVIGSRARSASAPAWNGRDEDWLAARRVTDGTVVWFGSRVLVSPSSTPGLHKWMTSKGFTPTGELPEGFTAYQTPSPEIAMQITQDLLTWPGLKEVHPVRQVQGRRHFQHSRPTADPYLSRQWHLENPFSSAFCPGLAVDLNFTAAWDITRGQGVTVACVDDGVEATHPDLAPNYVTSLNYNAFTGANDASHGTAAMAHGTAVAGLVGAAAGNGVGGSGSAPGVQLASWVIFNRFDDLPSEDRMAEVFKRRTDVVPLQNHSWGNADFSPLTPSRVESAAVSNAVTAGRNGLGVVMVRSAGNVRSTDFSRQPGVGDANLDGYASDPGVITVAAVGDAGRVAPYSTPGACVLLAAAGGAQDGSSRSIFTTDRTGANGWRTSSGGGPSDLADYLEGVTGFSGTSASAPQVSGVAALILSRNPKLSVRDVQQLLVVSSRHFDLLDYTVVTNGAGLRVNHNVGFGAPDAGLAVRWAEGWTPRPVFQEIRWKATNALGIPDDGLRLETTLPDFPGFLQTYPATSGLGRQPDPVGLPTRLVDLGGFNGPVQTNLNGAGAVIRRDPEGKATFADKIQWAFEAGARFAVIYGHSGGGSRFTRGAPDFYRFLDGTDFSPIPAVYMDQDNGEALVRLLADGSTVLGRLLTRPARYSFDVATSMHCEHVGVRIRWTHPRASDLRVTLTSPSGVISTMHRPGMNTRAVPSEQIFWSTQHFFENPQGQWQVAIGDEWPADTGSVQEVELIVRGVPILDVDRDSLPDEWERSHFGSLAFAASGDLDGDGVSELLEYLLNTDPNVSDTAFVPTISATSRSGIRVSWPSRDGVRYELISASSPAGPYTSLQILNGRWPEMTYMLEGQTGARFYKVRSL